MHVGARDGAGAQQHGQAARAVDDGRFDPHGAGRRPAPAAGRQSSSATCCAVVGLTLPNRLALGGHAPDGRIEPLAAASTAWATGGPGSAGPRCPAAGGARRARQARQDQRGPGQKASTAAARTAAPPGEMGDGRGIGHMHDQRVVGGPALGGKDLRHGGVVVGIGRQAVHRLGRQASSSPRMARGGLHRGVELFRPGSRATLRTALCREWLPPAAPRRAPPRAWRRSRSGGPSCARVLRRACRTGAGGSRARPAPAPRPG